MSRIINPYVNKPVFKLRGNLHAHSTRSDGSRSPQTVIDDFAARGYDFLMLSDHDTLSDYTGLDTRGMILIPGNEISGTYHTLHVNAKTFIPQNPDTQAVSDAIRADGGMMIMNHPNWQANFNHFPISLLRSCHGYQGVEIVNGTVRDNEGSEYALDKWDQLLSDGRKVWGFGNDDAHHDDGCGLAWNVVWTNDRSLEGIMEAFNNGSFYVSTGCEISDIRVFGEFLHVRAPDAAKLYISTLHGNRIAESYGNEIHYRLSDTDRGFLRVTAVAGPDQFAFTQPFFIKDITAQNKATLVYKIAKLTQRINKTEDVWQDGIWRDIAPTSRFLDTKTGKRAVFAPIAKLAYNDTHLFISIACPDPLIDELKVNKRQNGDNRIWSDDGVEIFIDPSNKRESYFQLMVNADGAWHLAAKNCKELVPDIQTHVTRSTVGYTLGIAIPRDQLPNGKESAKWAFNICRNKSTYPREASQWAATYGSYHSPKLFGEIHF